MMIRRSPHRRRGFSLLEVLLASLIAVFLLGAVYVAFDLTLSRTDIAREEAARANLARSVINRMTMDLNASLGPMPPKSGGGMPSTSTSTAPATDSSTTTDSATSGSTTTGSTSTGTTSSTTTSSTSGSTTGTATTDSTVTDASSPDAEVALAADVPFQAGVVGTDKQLTMFLSRVPQSLTDRQAAANPELLLPTDLRRVTYYLGSGGGLCRQDRPWVLAEGVRNSTDPDFTTEATDLIAPEVVDATFEYFDGSTWLSDWDGSYANTDGKSVTGPPRAIRVILILEFPETGDVVTRKTVQHTIAVRTANGLVPPAALPTDDTMTTTDPAAAATGTNGTTTTGGM